MTDNDEGELPVNTVSIDDWRAAFDESIEEYFQNSNKSTHAIDDSEYDKILRTVSEPIEESLQRINHQIENTPKQNRNDRASLKAKKSWIHRVNESFHVLDRTLVFPGYMSKDTAQKVSYSGIYFDNIFACHTSVEETAASATFESTFQRCQQMHNRSIPKEIVYMFYTTKAKKPVESGSSANNKQVNWEPSASLKEGISTRQLIIDGCNGPIRLLDQCLKSKNDSHKAISLLRVVSGENKGVRIDAVPKLDALLAKDMFCDVRIMFDGRAKKGKAGETWAISPRISVEVTSIEKEADKVIVEEVSKRQPVDINKTVDRVSLADVVQTFGDNDKNSGFLGSTIYSLRRTSEGPGRSRCVLKPFQLMRPDSLYCMFDFAPVLCSSAVSDAKKLKPMRRLMEVYKIVVAGIMTVVVTDDVLLRQYVIDSGGFVMTFEQLWDLLAA